MLTKAEVRAVKGFGPAYKELWQDVQAAADRVHLSAGADLSWAWHHLLMAVSNFKAQAPLFPAPLPPAAPTETLERREILEVPVPGGHLTVQADDQDTWRDLSERMRGLAVPRTTAVLSALWPGRHLIADWRALSAATALIGARNGWAHAPVNPSAQSRFEWTGTPTAGTARQPLNAPAKRACSSSSSSVFCTSSATPCPTPHGRHMRHTSKLGWRTCHRKARADGALTELDRPLRR
jgi:hypothetical protein